jgi:hypothetical protein
MIYQNTYLHAVQRIAGPGTAPGAGDTIIDNQGNRYRVVSEGEASIIRSGTTACAIRTLYSDGTIR